MNGDQSASAVGFGVLLGVVVTATAMCITFNNCGVTHTEAIKHGAAYYHPETGEFTWKGEATE